MAEDIDDGFDDYGYEEYRNADGDWYCEEYDACSLDEEEEESTRSHRHGGRNLGRYSLLESWDRLGELHNEELLWETIIDCRDSLLNLEAFKDEELFPLSCCIKLLKQNPISFSPKNRSLSQMDFRLPPLRRF